MRIFITGGYGFLGTNLVRALRSAGHSVVAPPSRECNLLRESSFASWRGDRFDVIWHLAAWTQAGDFCLRFPGEQWIHNQRMNTQVLAWWQAEQPQAKLITIGTSCAYAPEYPLREEHYHDGRPIESLYTYAMTKRMMQVGVESIARQYGLRYLTVVPSTLYGQEYHTDGRQLHFIFDLMRKIHRGHRYGEPVVLWGDGQQRRELIHVHDFIRAAMPLADRVDNQIVNIGAGEEHSIRHFAEVICRLIGYDPRQIQYDTTKYVGAKSKCLDVTRLRQLLPEFRPQSLEQGLPPVVDWVGRQMVD